MKPDRRPREFLENLPDTPMQLKMFSPETKQAAKHYEEELNKILSPWGVQTELFGSTDLEIAGKGEWEFAIYLDDTQWYETLVKLINHFASIYTLSEEFALFADQRGETEIEVIAMRGETALRNQALMKYWRTNPEAVKVYEQGKIKYSYSKQEYYLWKDQHIAEIVEQL